MTSNDQIDELIEAEERLEKFRRMKPRLCPFTGYKNPRPSFYDRMDELEASLSQKVHDIAVAASQ